MPIVWCAYIRHIDRFAVFSVPPVWAWSVIGLPSAIIAARLIRKLPAYIPIFLWIAFTLVFADEAKSLRNLGKPILLPGPPPAHNGSHVMRVATMNCAVLEYGDPSQDLARWFPDIVLLQDALPHHVAAITQRLFGEQGHFSCFGATNGIASRWPIVRQTNHPVLRNQQVTIQLPDESLIEVVNLHLQSASTDLSIWHRSTWSKHRIHRAARIQEIKAMLYVLQNTTPFPSSPVLLGGDFNAPATDVSHRLFSDHFTDSFIQAGRGLGNTYHRRFPILRIDALYHSRHFTAVRARTIESAHSDHRMLVVDYLRH
jgi:endonuclease/exonuclease/phosphatase (EEP) superfamily protein YafD